MMHFYNNRVSTLGKRKGGMFLHYQERLFGYLGIVVCQYVPGRKSSSSLLSLLLLLLLPCSVLLLLACHCTGAGVLLGVARAFFLFPLRPGAAECYLWDSIFYLSYVQVGRAAVAQRSDYYYYYYYYYLLPPNRSSNGSVRLSRSPRPSSSSCWVWFPSPACVPVVMLPVSMSVVVSIVSTVIWLSSSSPPVSSLLSPDVVVLSLKPSSPIVKLPPSVKFDPP